MTATGTVDLHLHSSASDGDHPPDVLAGLCAQAGLRTVALTDHNTTGNTAAMARALAEHGIDAISGCEISTRWRGGEHHLLALLIPLDHPGFAVRIERVRQADLARSRTWVQRAEEQGYGLRWGDIVAEVGEDRVPPFAVIARRLLAGDDPRLANHRSRRGSLFDDLFAPGRPLGAQAPYQPDLPEAIAWVRECGGVPVLAHPGRTLGRDDPEQAFRELAGQGLGGVEAWTPHHTLDQGARFQALARGAGLVVTAGADFHGPTVKPFVTAPGQVTHNGEELLDALRGAARG